MPETKTEYQQKLLVVPPDLMETCLLDFKRDGWEVEKMVSPSEAILTKPKEKDNA